MSFRVPPIGPAICEIALVGEAPGATEVSGIPSAGVPPQPFIGKSGVLLTELLNNAGILRSKCYLTNVMKERPSLYSNDISGDFATNTKNQVTHQSKRFLAYIEELREELMLIKSNVIVAVGKPALWALCGRTEITKLRGSVLESTLIPGRKVIPIIHPSATFDNYLWRYFIAMDLKRVKSDSTFPSLNLPERNIIMRPSFEASLAWLEDCHNYPLIGSDIEVLRNSLASYQAAKSPSEIMTIPLVAEGGDYFTPEQETALMLAIARLHQNPNVAKVGQYFIFDMTFLFHFYGIRTYNFEDTMMAHKIWRPDYPAGLDFITSIFTREPYYKDEGKKWFRVGGSWEQFWLYGGKDPAVTMEAFPKIKEELIKQGNLETYEEQKKIVPSLMFMQERGVRIDVEGLREDSADSASRILELEQQLNELAGRPLKYGSPKQLAEYFYGDKGIPAYRSRGKKGAPGNVTTNADALKRIARKGFKEANIMLEIRQISKLRSTYYEMPIDEDGRFHTLFNPVGTKFGRTSSEQTITDTGGNSKNFPYEFKKHLMCDPGYIGYELDLSQAENRIVAYVGPVQTMIEAFESGADVHSLTGALISGLSPEEVRRQHKEDIKAPLAGERYTWRFFGKKANHCKLRSCEVLTEDEGWISIEDAYIRSKNIAQWQENGEIRFVQPTNWFIDTYTGPIVTFSGRDIFQEMTPEHRIPCIKRQSKSKGIVTCFTADNIKLISSYEWPTSGKSMDGDISIPDLYIRLAVAFQADGTWNYRSPKWNLKNEYKIQRLRLILNLLGCSYTERVSKDNYTIIQIKAENIERDVLWNLFPKHKLWPYNLVRLNRPSMDSLCDEVVRWDGDFSSYHTSIKRNADIIQTLFHLSGFKSHVGWACNETKTYRVSKISKGETRLDTLSKSIRNVINEPILCPTVPSGYFLCRENGIVSVTGNSLNYDLGYKTFSYYYEIPESDGKFIVEKYHRAYPGVRNGYHRWVKEQLGRDRTLTNAYGRKVKFLDRWSDGLFQDAYAFFPQSTVADKMNREGHSFLLNNQKWFRWVEPLNEVYDSIWVQIPISKGATYHADCIMRLRDSLETAITWKGRSFVIPTDAKMWLSFGHTEELKYKGVSDAGALAQKIKENYEELEFMQRRIVLPTLII